MRALPHVKYIIKSTAMTGLFEGLTPVSRPVHGVNDVAEQHPLDIGRRRSANPDMQFKEAPEGTHVIFNGLEFEDMAAALYTAASRIRKAAGEIPRIEQRRELCAQADRFDWMLAEMHLFAGEELDDLASSQCFRFLRSTSDGNQLPQKD